MRQTHLCGAFSLVKDEQKDRLILDARAPNELEETLKEWCQTLGSVSAICQIELPADRKIILSGTDLRDYYYCFRVSKPRSYRNAINLKLTPGEVADWKSFHPSMWSQKELYPCLATLAMGDCQAVELGQLSHVKLALNSGAISPFEMLTVHGRGPRGFIAGGIVIDDVLLIEQVPRALEEVQKTESVRRLHMLIEEYTQNNLTAHPKKTFRATSSAEIWGAVVDGDSGVVKANPKRTVPLMYLTARVAALGYSTVGLLEILAGSWVSVLQVRRRMMCLLSEIYEAQKGRAREEIIELSAPLRQELWVLVCLGPLAYSSMRWQSIPELFMSDASEKFTASVSCSIPIEFAKEMQRHSLLRGSWNRLLTPWKAWLRSHQTLLAEEELPEGVPLVSHPLWLMAAESFHYKMHHRTEVHSRRHINALELQSVLEVEKKLAQRRQCCRYLLGSDSQVALAALVKGRSSSPRLNQLLARSLANLLGSELMGQYGYVPSLANPADDPTRSQPIRKPVEPLPKWWEDLVAGDFSSFDSWLGQLGFFLLRVAKLPFEESETLERTAIRESFLPKLRSVQKESRLQRFDERERASKEVSPVLDAKEITRGHNKEPEGQTKNEKKSPIRSETDEGPNNPFVASERVAPPEKIREQSEVLLQVNLSGRKARGAHVRAMENSSSPWLDERQRELVQEFAGSRGVPGELPLRRFFLDLYTGRGGVATTVWCLCLDL